MAGKGVGLVPQNGKPVPVTGAEARVNGDFRVFRRAGVKSFTHPGLRFITALTIARLAVLRTSRGRADRLRRRSACCRTALLTSRYPLALDDRGAREGARRERDPFGHGHDGAVSGCPR